MSLLIARRGVAASACAVLLVASKYDVSCDGRPLGAPPVEDAGVVDAGFDAAVDAGADAGSDAGLDAGAGADAGVDAGVDAGFDAGAEVDAGTDDGGCGPFVVVNAVPGTLMMHVMQNTTTMSQNLTTTAGDLLVAIVYEGQGPSPAGGTTTPSTAPNMTITVSDTLGSAWHAGALYENGSSHHEAVQIFYAAGVAGGADTVTMASVAGASVNPWVGLFLQEYSGVATTNVVDVSAGQTAPDAGLAPQPGAMTLTRCSLVVSAHTDGTIAEMTATIAAPWSMRSSDFWDPGYAVDNAPLGAVAGTVVNPITDLANYDAKWVSAQIAFRGATTPDLAQPTSLGLQGNVQSFTVGACSSAVTLVTQLASVVVPTSTGADVTLSSSGLSFFADSACAYPLGTAHLGAGSSGSAFFIKPTMTGSHMLDATATGLTAVHAIITVN